MSQGQLSNSAERPVEEVAELWTALLHRKSVPHDVSFIELGGDSLLIIALLEEIEGRFGVYLEAEEVLEDLTVTGIATAIAGARQAG
ncbi:phosphopantetheine-binding protein [Streptacidiphilus griseoplanus]|uniref:phosphopantetheine-binding protein n=1 Tax=Peterkaempfera griseoplana TaxID=66896 RepID=UPI0006E3156C|nr:phosphopantetheine-binding protein [Peterkaempfera griseoplana]BCN13442.1 acyl carrier protein [Peterkaempfera griseoplana]